MASDVRECDLTVETDRVISGYRKYHGWGGPMQFFFVAEFSKPFGKVVAVVDNGKPAEGKHFNGRSVRAEADFTTTDKEKLLVKVGFSAVSVDGTEKPGGRNPGFRLRQDPCRR